MGLATVIIKAEGKPPPTCSIWFHLGRLHTILDKRLGIFENHVKGNEKLKNNQNSQELTVQQAISRAKKATKQGNTAVAVNLYQAILKHQPNNLFVKKQLHKLQKESPRSPSAEEKTLSPPQDEISALVNLYNSGQMIKTEQACRELLQTHPHSLLVLNILGAALRGQGKLQEAVQAFNRSIQLNPDYAEGYSNRGNTLRELGQLDAAVESYEKALAIKPDFAEAHNNLGNTLRDLNQLDAAVKSYKKALALKPDYAEAHSNLGLTFHALSQLAVAVESYQNALAINPDYAEAHSNLGNTLHALGQLNVAVESYQNALAIKPDYAEAHSNLGATLKELRQLDAAAKSYQNALAIKPDYAEAHSNLGNTLRELNRLEEAEASYRQAIALKPDLAEAHNNLGFTLRELGKLEDAEASHRKAIALKPDYADAHSDFGVTLQDSGKLEDAEASYRKAIALKPDYADAHSNLGAVLQELGKSEDALVQFKESFELVRGKNPVDPFHKSFRIISKAKMDHDIEQFKYLADSGYEVEKFKALAKLYTDVSLEIDWPVEETQFALSNKHQKLLKETYNRSIHLLEAPIMGGGALSDTLEREKITKDYFKHDHGLTYIDNFLTPSTLDSIRKFLLGSTIWFDLFHKGGYLGAYLKDGLASPLLLQIANELRNNFPGIFKNHQLKQLWAYKYDSRAYKNNNGLTGIEPHADFAAVNVNFWVTPAVANLNPESGGLIVYNTPAPLEWDFMTFNNNRKKILEHIADNNDEKSVIPYNENRVVIFNSNLIHETDRFEFQEGYENRRINVTMLFGSRRD